jgi:phytoene synthase
VNAAKITRESKSNLALAFISLSGERKRDITTFYAFCRVIDDIADSVTLNVTQKQEDLATWRRMLRAPEPSEPALAADVRRLIDRYALTPEMLEEIIAGVEMDLTISRYANFDELRVYCYRVASAVGLVSIEIFGYHDPACKEYAVQLGLALQTTNIIRDVEKDLQNNRIYLPLEEMSRFGYSELNLRNRQYNEHFMRLMEFQGARAQGFFARASELLPVADRKSMVAAEIMGSVYRGLLRKMERDRFRVFEKQYRLTKIDKAGRVVWQLLKSI